MSTDNAAMSSVFLKTMNHLAKMNVVYGEYFKTNPPAPATVEVARLPRDVLTGIAVIATEP